MADLHTDLRVRRAGMRRKRPSPKLGGTRQSTFQRALETYSQSSLGRRKGREAHRRKNHTGHDATRELTAWSPTFSRGAGNADFGSSPT